MSQARDCLPKNNGTKNAGEQTSVRLEDSAVIRAVQDYLAALEVGRRPDRQEFLDRYPGLAPALAECLDALEFMHGAAPQVQPAVDSPEPSAAALYAGTALGDFRIFREIGRGGMGVVYEAEQVSLGRRVAVKVLPFAATLDEKQLRRFKNEAQAAAHLHHTNIVPIHFVGCERGVHFYAMQYIDGQSLATLIRELRLVAGLHAAEEGSSAGSALALASELVSGHWEPCRRRHTDEPRSPGSVGRDSAAADTSTRAAAALSTERSTKHPAYFRTVAGLGVQAGNALEFAHQLGVVHRDIKPANLLVDAHGQLWITDFGLAHCQGNPGLTMTGDLVGTLRYMSPEQASGKRGQVDHFTDIYSLGATLYELLTLEPAFAGHDRQQLLQQIALQEPRQPRRLNRAIPAELETIVLKAMAKNPWERYATAQELADDLKRFLEDKPIRARRPTLLERATKWSRRHRSVVVSAVVFLVVAVIGMAISMALIWREQTRAEARSHQARRAVDEMYGEVAEQWLDQEPHMEEVQRRFLLKALEFYEEFAADLAKEPHSGLAQATAYRRVGDIQQKLGDYARAEDAYRRAIALCRQLADDFPAEPKYRELLAACYHNLGKRFSRAKQFQEAEQAYREAVALREKLVAERPDSPDYPYELAASLSDLGRVLHTCGRPQPAEAAYRDALKLMAPWPEESKYQDQRGDTLANLAELLGGRGDAPQDRQYLEQAIGLQRAALRAGPRNATYRVHLANQLERLGRTLTRSEELAGAEAAYRQALAHREKLAEDFPKVPEYRSDLAGDANALGDLLAATGRDAEAEQVYRDTLVVREKLANDFPRDAHYRRDLAWLLANCPAPPLRNPDRAVTFAKEAVALAPKGCDCWRALGVAHYRAGDWKAAVAALTTAMELRAGGDSAEWFFLAMAHWQSGDKQQGRAWYDRAVHWMEEKQPRNETLRRWRAEAAVLLGPADKPMEEGKHVPALGNKGDPKDEQPGVHSDTKAVVRVPPGTMLWPSRIWTERMSTPLAPTPSTTPAGGGLRVAGWFRAAQWRVPRGQTAAEARRKTPVRRTIRLLVLALSYATVPTGCSRSNNAELAQARAEAEAAKAEAAAAKAELAKLRAAAAVAQTPATVFTEELVYVQSKDGIANGGAIFAPPKDSAKPVAVIWIHGWGVNFYQPTYVKIGRSLADRGYTCISANTRMHDLGNVTGYRWGKRIRGGGYWGVASEEVRDLAAWIDFAADRGFNKVVLVGHSAGWAAVRSYQAERQYSGVVGVVLASGAVGA